MALGLGPSVFSAISRENFKFAPCIATFASMVLWSKHAEVVGGNIECLLESVAMRRPGIDAQEWDKVAGDVSEQLYALKAWNSPYCVYDGEHCHRLL